jgi:hypothetical protein
MTRGESVLRQVAANNPHLTFQDLMGVSDELPDAVVRQIANPVDVKAALDCWRDMMHVAVDAVAERYKSGEQA